MLTFRRLAALIWLLAGILTGTAAFAQPADPLPSWNDGPARQAILAFVAATTTPGAPGFVAPEERLATFDNDGTLWVEQPIYAQVAFAIDRVRALAPQHSKWKTTEPYSSILTGDRAALAKLTLQDLEKIVAVTHSGMSVEAFQATVKDWLATAKDPRFKRPYTELVYQPMVEVLQYLRANGFRTYIVTGGGQEFVRAFAQTVYGVPPEQVIGSAGVTKYRMDKDGKPMLVKQPKVLLVDDKAGKPEAINLFIGRRPQAAFGNSTGDQQMLEWTQDRAKAGDAGRLMMLVRHDDAGREYAYGPDTRIGTFSDALTAEAKQNGWSIISIKADWKRIFVWQAP